MRIEHAAPSSGKDLLTIFSNVTKYARYNLCNSDPEELASEALSRSLRYIPEFNGEATFQNLVIQIACNKFKDDWRKQNLEERHGKEIFESLRPNSMNSEQVVESKLNLDLILNSIEQLSSPLKETLLLKLEGLSHAQIAIQLGITENMSRARLYDARVSLKSILEDSGLPVKGYKYAK